MGNNFELFDSYGLYYLVKHMIDIKDWPNVFDTLCDLSFLSTKCNAGLLYSLTGDYSLVSSLISSEEKALLDFQKFCEFKEFTEKNMRTLSIHMDKLLQIAVNYPQQSAVYQAAMEILKLDTFGSSWFEWKNKNDFRQVSQDIGLLSTWDGHLPAFLDFEKNLCWLSTENGDIIAVDINSGEPLRSLNGICENCQIMTTVVKNLETCLLLINQDGRYVLIRYEEEKILIRQDLEIDKGVIAASCICEDGILLLITYPNQSSSRLMLFKFDLDYRLQKFSEILLHFRYIPKAGLSTIKGTPYAICPYGERIRDVALVNYRTGNVIKVLKGHETFMESCCSIDGYNLFATGDLKGVVYIWDMGNLEKPHKLNTGMIQICQIAWSAKNRFLLISGLEKYNEATVNLYDLANDKEGGTYLSVGDPIDVAIFDEGDRILFGNKIRKGNWGNSVVSLFDYETMMKNDLLNSNFELSSKKDKHNSVVLDINVVMSGKYYLTTSLFGEVWLWETGSNTVVWKNDEETRGVTFGTLVSDDEAYIGVAQQKSVIEFDDGKPVFKSSINRILIYSLEKNRLKLLDIFNISDLSSVPLHLNDFVLKVQNLFKKMVFETGRFISKIPEEIKKLKIDYVPAFSFFPDNDIVSVGSKDELQIWNYKNCSLIASYPMPNSISSISIINNKNIVVGDSSGLVWFLELHNISSERITT